MRNREGRRESGEGRRDAESGERRRKRRCNSIGEKEGREEGGRDEVGGEAGGKWDVREAEERSTPAYRFSCPKICWSSSKTRNQAKKQCNFKCQEAKSQWTVYLTRHKKQIAFDNCMHQAGAQTRHATAHDTQRHGTQPAMWILGANLNTSADSILTWNLKHENKNYPEDVRIKIHQSPEQHDNYMLSPGFAAIHVESV